MADPTITRPYAPANEASEQGRAIALIRSLLNGVHTAALVEVKAVTNAGGVEPLGYVDVQPLVGQLDGAGRVIDHAPIYNARYQRVQGGANAVILDPQVGDVGLAVFCERDITGVKKSGQPGPPGSLRKFSMADAVYCFSAVTQTPVQYVQFNDAGITIHSPDKITLSAPQVVVNASTSFTVNSPQSTFSDKVTIHGLLTFLAGLVGSAAAGAAASITGAVNFLGALTSNGKNIADSHTHSGVQPGGGSTGGVT